MNPILRSASRSIARVATVASLAAVACLGGAGVAHAQTPITWTGATNASWGTGSNWSGGAVPTSSSDATFDLARNTFLNVSGTVNKLIFSNTASIAGSAPANNATATLTINNGLTHTANSGGSFVRIQTITLGGNQTWSLNGTNGLNNTAANGFTIVPNSGATVANTFSLNGHTLTKTGSGQVVFGAVTIGDGNIDINEGSVRFATFGSAVGAAPPTTVGGSGTITVKGGAALLLAMGSSNTRFNMTKLIRMEGTVGSPSTMQTNGTVTVTGTIASPIEWAGVSNLEHYWQTGGNRRFEFAGNWTGSGTVNTVLTSTSAPTQESVITLSGSNGGFGGLVDNMYSGTGAGASWVQFGSSNAGSANAEWSLSNANASYRLNGFNVELGALSGTTGTLANGAAATASTASIGGKGIDTTFGGVIANGGAAALSITKVGAGRLTLSGTSSYTGSTAVDAGTLAVDGSIAASSGVGVASGATLGGSGAVSVVSGAGLVSPGNSPGILTATSLDPSTGLDFGFEFTGTGSPDYASATSSTNDVLRLTGATPSLSALSANNTVSVYFDGSILVGDTFRGGTYVDSATTAGARDAFASAIAGANWQYYVFGSGGGSHSFGGRSYYTLAEYDPTLTIDRTVVAETANFAGGTAQGAVTQFSVVPEPGAIGLVAAALGGLAAASLHLRSRGRRA